jgi:hypothetical protein
MVPAQTQVQRETLSVQGYRGQATVIRNHGRVFVDVQDLARITKGSLSFEGDRIILTLAASEASGPPAAKSGFSLAFMKAAIEAMASIREWGGMLQVIVENGYPVGKAMAGNTIRAYQGRAADSVALASAAASTDDDHLGLELLRNEFNKLQAWAESFVDARNSLRAADLSSSSSLSGCSEVDRSAACPRTSGSGSPASARRRARAGRALARKGRSSRAFSAARHRQI